MAIVGQAVRPSPFSRLLLHAGDKSGPILLWVHKWEIGLLNSKPKPKITNLSTKGSNLKSMINNTKTKRNNQKFIEIMHKPNEII